MRTTRTITTSLAAVLAAAVLAGPAAAVPGDATKANVYVPPASLYTVTSATHSAKANVYVPPAALSTNPKPISRHVTATSAPASGFDWGSAGIGAAVIVGALLIGLGGAAEARRRRQIQPAATG